MSDRPRSGTEGDHEEAAAGPVREHDVLRAEIDVVLADLTSGDPGPPRKRLAELREQLPATTRLDDVEAGFGLTGFERAVLVLACGPDLSVEAARRVRDHAGTARPSFTVALAGLPNAHWDAVTPSGPLRYWGLLDLVDPADPVTSPLRPDESVLHYLVGADSPDETLHLLSQPMDVPTVLPPTLREVALAVTRAWGESSPVLLRGPSTANARVVCSAAGIMAGLTPRLVSIADLPGRSDDVSRMLRRMTRQTVLGHWAWVVDATDGTATQVDALSRLLSRVDTPIVVLLGAATGDSGGWGMPSLTVPRLSVGERRITWTAALQAASAHVDAAELDAISGAYDLPVPDVVAVADSVAAGSSIWGASRRRIRADVGGLATLRTPAAGWDCLVLPESTTSELHAIAASVRHRGTVLDEWGFGQRPRGLGTAALFAGASGTGKTLAAEVIAHELDLDLVQVDLSQVVNKYIGETEKHLARLFDAAENGGVVLLFDEADALFGKRSEVKDSHDRYANVEVGFLLQRLESFTGLAILTTNARGNLDRAFIRRLSSIVTFPYPDATARRRLWETSIPATTPCRDVDLSRLAQADLSGGEIAAAALQGAYLAAADGQPVGMAHLTEAVRWELSKSGRTATRGSR